METKLKRNLLLSNISIYIFFLTIFVGCAINPYPKIDMETAGKSITETRNSIAIATNEKADEYAPKEFSKAERLLQQAEDMMAKKRGEEVFDLTFLADIEAKIATAMARDAKAKYRIEKAKENQIETILEIRSNEVEIAKTRQAIAEKVALEAQINSEMSSQTAENRIGISKVELAIAKAEIEIKLAEQMNASKYVKQEFDAAKNLLQEAKTTLANENFDQAITSAIDAAKSATNAQIQAKAKSDTEFADTMQKKERALIALAKAEVAIEEARASMADKLAKDLYNQAEKTMQEVRASYDAGDYDHARSLAEQTRVSASSARAVVETKEKDEKKKEDLEEKKANALDVIAKAERYISQAFNAKATELANDLFKQAQGSLETAKQALQSDDLDKTISAAQESIFNSNLAIATSELKSGQQKKNTEAEQALIEEAKKLTDVSVRETEKGIAISFSIDVFTKNGEIKNDFVPKLKEIAELLKKYPQYRILIEGHTDNSGKEKANIKLSSERANAILDHIVNTDGVPLDRLSSVGYGGLRPITSNSDSEGIKQNRRIDIVIITKL
jgi:OOP family OmpA-OmpF porin